MDEGEAISRLKGGDINGLEPLVRKYQVQAVRTAYLITRDRSMAEDVVQTVFLRVFERIHQLDSRRPVGPWFLRSVVNESIKAVGRDRKSLSLDEGSPGEDVPLVDLLPDPGATLEELAEKAETRQTVWDALGRLTPGQRAAIVLRYYVGLKESEVAERLGRSVGAVKWRLHAAREHLRPLLKTLLPGQSDHDSSQQTKGIEPKRMVTKR